jgi:hypothetical protein
MGNLPILVHQKYTFIQISSYFTDIGIGESFMIHRLQTLRIFIFDPFKFSMLRFLGFTKICCLNPLTNVTRKARQENINMIKIILKKEFNN